MDAATAHTPSAHMHTLLPDPCGVVAAAQSLETKLAVETQTRIDSQLALDREKQRWEEQHKGLLADAKRAEESWQAQVGTGAAGTVQHAAEIGRSLGWRVGAVGAAHG